MDPQLLAGLAKAAPGITQGVSIAGDFYNAIANRRSVKKQNQADRDHAGHMFWLQRQQNLEDWNRQNEYNAPEQQMQRLRQAGLNPNLVYGKGAENTASAVQKTNYAESKLQAPQYDFSFQNALSNYMQIKNASIQTDNLAKTNELLGADIAMKQAQTETERSKKTGQDLMNIKFGTENDLLKFDYGQKLRLADIQYDNAILDVAMKSQSMEINGGRFELEKIKNSADVAQTYANTLESQARKLLIEAQTSKNAVEVQMLHKQIEYMGAQIDNLKKTGKLLDGQTAEQAINTQIKELQLKLDKKYGPSERGQNQLNSLYDFLNKQKSFNNPLNNTMYGDALKMVPGIGGLFIK